MGRFPGIHRCIAVGDGSNEFKNGLAACFRQSVAANLGQVAHLPQLICGRCWRAIDPGSRRFCFDELGFLYNETAILLHHFPPGFISIVAEFEEGQSSLDFGLFDHIPASF